MRSLVAVVCCLSVAWLSHAELARVPGAELLFTTTNVRGEPVRRGAVVRLNYNSNRTWYHPHFPASAAYLVADEISVGTPTASLETQLQYDPVAPQLTLKVKDITGPGVTTQFEFEGTDLGEPFMFQNGAFGFFFGDTFDEYQAGGTGWRSPVMCRSHTYPLDGGITWDNCAGTGSESSGRAKQILPNAQNGYNKYGQYEVTVIPGDGITVSDVNYLSFMSVHSWSDPNWATNYAGLATSTNYGEDWTVQSPVWWNDGNGDMHQMWTMCNGNDGYIYIISCAFGRVRTEGMILQKVPEKQLLVQSAYIPWGWTEENGWQWGQPATPILPGPLGELSLRLFNKTWVLSYFSPSRYAIVMRTASQIDGIWSAEKVMLTGTEVPQLYGGFLHSLSTLSDLHFIVSQWITSTNTPYRAMQYKTSLSPAPTDPVDNNSLGFTLYYPFRVSSEENQRISLQQSREGYYTVKQRNPASSPLLSALSVDLPKSCATKQEMDSYLSFLEQVGTHYISAVTMQRSWSTGHLAILHTEKSPIHLLLGDAVNKDCITQATSTLSRPP